MRPGSPVPRDVGDELRRVVERWQQLPLDHALSRMPLAADLVQRLADEVAQSRGREPEPVPDLGPGVVMDQLTVMVWDHCAAFGGTRHGGSQPGETRPGGSQPGETRPGGSQPGETRPGGSQPGETRHGGSQHGAEATAALLTRLSGIRHRL